MIYIEEYLHPQNKDSVWIDVTDSCNYSCEYCNAPYKNININEETGEYLEYLNLKNAVKISSLFQVFPKIKKIPRKDIIIFGGEPSIYPLEYNQKIVSILKRTSPDKIIYMTNFSRDIQYYLNLDVDLFFLSFHQSEVTILDFFKKIVLFSEALPDNCELKIILFEKDYNHIFQSLNQLKERQLFEDKDMQYFSDNTLVQKFNENIDDPNIFHLGYTNYYFLNNYSNSLIKKESQ